MKKVLVFILIGFIIVNNFVWILINNNLKKQNENINKHLQKYATELAHEIYARQNTVGDIDISKPSGILKQIYWSEQTGKYDKLKDIFFSIKVDKKTTFDLFLQGIKTRDRYSGNFTYYPASCLYHIEQIDNYIKPLNKDDKIKQRFEFVKKYSEEVKNALENEPERILYYEKGSTLLAFIKIDGKLKLFYVYDFDIIDIKSKI